MSVVDRVALGELTDVVTKGTTPTTLKKEFVISGIPFLRINNLDNGLIDYEDILYIDDDTNTLLRRSVVKPGDFLLTIAGTIGKTVIVPDDAPLMNCNQAIAIIRVKDNLDKRYLKYWLSTTDAHAQITGAKVTATISNLSLGQIKELKVPLPPLEEQKHIAVILDKADAIRRKRQQAIDLADQLLCSVFLDMFGDPVTNPKGWEKNPLKSLASKIGSGATPRGGKNAYVDEGISLIRSLNIHDNKFIHKNLAFITNNQADRLSNVVVEKNDVLLNITGASVCRCAMVDELILPARVNQHVCIIRPRDEMLNPVFLLHYLISDSYKRKLLNFAGAGGATREALTKEQVEKLMIAVPPIDKQERFENIVKKILVKKVKEKYAHQNINELFLSLTQRAFRGELSKQTEAA